MGLRMFDMSKIIARNPLPASSKLGGGVLVGKDQLSGRGLGEGAFVGFQPTTKRIHLLRDLNIHSTGIVFMQAIMESK